MKTTITTLAAISLALLSSCDKKEVHSKNDGHNHESHAGHNHAAGDKEHGEHEGAGAHDDHSGHDHVKAGPNKGRMISTVSPQAEFVALENGKVQITFFDKSMNILAPNEQAVTVVSGERNNPTELSFTVEGQSLISTTALPKGNGFPTIVAITPKPGAKEIVTRFTLNLNDCSSCNNKEYSCECHH